MTTNPQKPVSMSPFSMRITPETRASLDYLVERTGLKDAQVIRMAIKALEVQERSLAGLRAAAAPKPARTKR